ncbi:pyridoxal phosphate-dependent aminotransferase [Peptoniphilus catoniae]|uniref:pyridoxal phosphate-dependent aminotransferase n=1 Tax=Peptoniphilus catoniae TaxID=1660341 RepID=UPI0010FD77DF|nr:pyridoxal phosphate-dependent aminotransferase [Peptoniphilus catoniae]
MKKLLSEKVNQLAPSGIRKVNEKALAMERKGEKIFHFEIGRPDFDTPEYIKKACIDSINNGDVFYTSNFGIPVLRQEIAKKLKKDNNLDYKESEILVTAGLSEAVFDILYSIIDEGDEIILPDPVWANYLNVTKLLKANIKNYKLAEENDFQIDIEDLKSKITDKTKAMLIISPNNPTGSVLKENTIKEIAELAKEKDFYIISDEIYERIIYDEKHLSIGSLPGMRERTITLNGFSKAYSMTGWRLGYIAAPEELIKGFNKIHQHNTSCATSFVQHAGYIALRDEQNEVEDMVKEYRRRRDYIVKTINSSDYLSCKTPGGAFYVYINIKKTGKSSQEVVDYLLDEAKIALVPGNCFGESGEGYIRMSYASSYENIVEGCDILLKAIDKLMK